MQHLPAPHLALATAAVAAPVLIAFNVAPSATFINQAAALVGWGAWAMLLAMALPSAAPPSNTAPDRGAAALLLALLLIAASAFAAPLWTGLPWTLALSAIGVIGAAMLVAALAVALQRAGLGEAAFASFCFALLAAGVLAALVGFVQVYAPAWADGQWIAAGTLGARAVGNLRQPNHQSSLLLWAMIATVWLGGSGRLSRVALPALLLALLAGVVLTASRTGMVGAALLTLWGLADRRLTRRVRLQLVLVPLVYFFWYELFAALAHQGGTTFAGEAQMHKADPSSSRFGIWANTLTLIAAHPWAGVGFGGFNFAWSLHVFPGRPVAFFDHTHNLPLQLAVELGLPLAALVLALLLYALWRALRLAREGEAGDIAARRAALAMVVMIALHSQLEYPLWYAYFLLPAAFAFGIALGGPAPAGASRRSRAAGARPPLWLPAALALLLGGAASLADYRRVAVIFSPASATPLAQRIEEGRQSWFFGHHADYAAATVAAHPSDEMAALARATHYLLDTRITVAWAKALAERGEVDKARHLAARLREFRNPLSAEFFAVCDEPAGEGAPKPFQCEAPRRGYDYVDFR
ncbi:Wzy polymerase domain-containing protein [Piscinibacter sp.]|uniref:PglL family O-oligosaccharyltransferase n=1 Tax=Piscinibacter sp. TaxID=1903157 RepID=UPI0039E684E6